MSSNHFPHLAVENWPKRLKASSGPVGSSYVAARFVSAVLPLPLVGMMFGKSMGGAS